LRRGRRPSIPGRACLHGFTLIELLVVIAIISLLVSILLPSLNRAKDLAKKTLCLSNLRGLGTALHMYRGENDNLSPDHSGPTRLDMWMEWGTVREFGLLFPYIGEDWQAMRDSSAKPERPAMMECPLGGSPWGNHRERTNDADINGMTAYYINPNLKNPETFRTTPNPMAMVDIFNELNPDTTWSSHEDIEEAGLNFLYWDGHAAPRTYSQLLQCYAGPPLQSWNFTAYAAD
jgi:prepilin-type N-terminal cleavage/methylation domain-containing protein/prepilin-type processing-associated H-X9-DG protein